MNEFLGLVKDPVTQSEAPLLYLKLISGLHIHISIQCTCTYILYRTLNMYTSVSPKSHICIPKVWKSKKSDKLLCVPLQCHCNHHITSPSPPKSLLSSSPITFLLLDLAKGLSLCCGNRIDFLVSRVMSHCKISLMLNLHCSQCS